MNINYLLSPLPSLSFTCLIFVCIFQNVFAKSVQCFQSKTTGCLKKWFVVPTIGSHQLLQGWPQLQRAASFKNIPVQAGPHPVTTQEVDIAAWPSRPGQWLGCIGSQVSYACSWIFIRLLWQFDFSFCPVLVSLPAFAGTDLQSIAYTANSLTMSASQKPNMSQCDKWTAVLVPMRSCYC